MALTIDNRALPEEFREEVLASAPMFPPKEDPNDPKEPGTEKVTGQAIFSLPEPDMEWMPGSVKQDTVVAGVPGLSLTVDGARKDYVFMHIHGGGFTGGNPVSAYRLMDSLLREFNMNSYSVCYTLVPNATAPVQLDECMAFYEGLLAMGYENIILGGESAGANLSLALTLELMKQGKKLPTVVISSSAPTDFSGIVDRHDPDGNDNSLGALYGGELGVNDYRVSPLLGDYNGFPPVLMQTGQLENLKYDSIALGEKLKDCDCDATLSIWEGGFHAFGIDPGDTWIHRSALRQILDFMKEKANL